MKKAFHLFIGLTLCLTCMACAEDVPDVVKLGKVKNEDISRIHHLANQYPQAGYDEMAARADHHSLQGKSIAFFGASLANIPACDMVKKMLAYHLGCKVYSYGHGGYSYGGDTNTLKKYADALGSHDIYVVWSTTNDYFAQMDIGSVNDCTRVDNFRNTETSSGGMNYVLHQIRSKHPDAQIIGIVGPKFFNSIHLDGAVAIPDPLPDTQTYSDYLKAFMDCYRLHDASILNLWNLDCFNFSNWQEFYDADGVHPNENGYFFLGIQIVNRILDIS